jgi:hypothetical protein
VVLDDLLNEAYSRDVWDLYTMVSHQGNISVILFAQNVFHQERFSRQDNAMYLVVF